MIGTYGHVCSAECFVSIKIQQKATHVVLAESLTLIRQAEVK